MNQSSQKAMAASESFGQREGKRDESPQWSRPLSKDQTQDQKHFQHITSNDSVQFLNQIAKATITSKASREDDESANTTETEIRKTDRSRSSRPLESLGELIHPLLSERHRSQTIDSQMIAPKNLLSQRDLQEYLSMCSNSRGSMQQKKVHKKLQPIYTPGQAYQQAELSQNQEAELSPSSQCDHQQFQIQIDLLKHQNLNAKFIDFAEKLSLRDQVGSIHEALSGIENVLLTVISKENPKLYDQIVHKHTMLNYQGEGSLFTTHADALQSTTELASQLCETFLQFYQNKNYEPRSFGQLMFNIDDQNVVTDRDDLDHVYVEDGEATEKKRNNDSAFSFDKNNESQSETQSEEIQEQHNTFHQNVSSNQNAIFHMNDRKAPIGLATFSPPSSHKNLHLMDNQYYREGQNRTLVQSQENLISLEELKLCNEIIARLKSENEELSSRLCSSTDENIHLAEQLQKYNQEQQVTRKLIEELQDQMYRKNETMDGREAHSLVVRLQEELLSAHQSNQANLSYLSESSQSVQFLQDQVRQYKDKLQVREMELQRLKSFDKERMGDVKELNSLRQYNQDLAGKIKQLQVELISKSSEVDQIEQNAHNLLLQAQQDAEECIKYFKDLALQNNPKLANRERDNSKEGKLSRFFGGLPQSLKLDKSAAVFSSDGSNLKTHRSRSPIASSTSKVNEESLRKRALTPTPTATPTAALRRPLRFVRQQQLDQVNSMYDQHVLLQKNTSKNSLNEVDEEQACVCHFKLFKTKTLQEEEFDLRLSCALDSLSLAYEELQETKVGILEFVSEHRDAYCTKIQTFSVLAYDYLEKINNFVQKDAELPRELEKHSILIERLKYIATEQSRHIEELSNFSESQKQQFQHTNAQKDLLILQREQEISRLTTTLKNELPLLNKSLEQSEIQMRQVKTNLATRESELVEMRKIHDLARKKNKILEEELDKSLNQTKILTEELAKERSSYERISEQIKELWMTEVRQSSIDQEISTRRSGEIPMPLTWMAEVQDHIRQLKQMNDFQRDEVYNLFNLLGDRTNMEGGPECYVRESQDSSSNQSCTLSEKAATSQSRQPPKSKSSRIERFSQVHRDEYISEADEYEIASSENIQEQFYRAVGTSVTKNPTPITATRHSKEMSFSQDENKAQNIAPFQADASERTSYRQKQEYGGLQKVGSKSMDRQESTRMSISNVQVNSRTSRHQPTPPGPYQSISSNVRDFSHPPASRPQAPSVNSTRHEPLRNPHMFGVPSTRSQDYNRRMRFQSHSNGSNSAGASARGSDKPKKRLNIRMVNEPMVISPQYKDPSLPQTTDRVNQFLSSTGKVSSSMNRNELYVVLRDEIKKMRGEIIVGKETIYQMKQEINRSKQEVAERNDEIEDMRAQYEDVATRNQQLEDELQEAEAQIEDMNSVIVDREKCVNDMRENIGEFEQELQQLTDRMNNVVKLNVEISAASEHWEACFHKAKKDIQGEKEKGAAVLEQQRQQFEQFEAQFNQRLKEKEHQLNQSSRMVEKERKVREAIEETRANAKGEACQTDSAFENLEKQNKALQKQLSSVKNDISSVLDQYDREQGTVRLLNRKVSKHKESKKKYKKEVTELKHQLELNESTKITEQSSITERVMKADQVNFQLQAQVENFSQMTEQLQDQLRSAEEVNNDLHEQIAFYEGTTDEKTQQLVELQNVQIQDRDMIKQLQRAIQKLRSSREIQQFGENSEMLYAHQTGHFGHHHHTTQAARPPKHLRARNRSAGSSGSKATNSEYFTLKPHDELGLKNSLDNRIQRPRSHNRGPMPHDRNTLDYFPQQQSTSSKETTSSYINTTELETMEQNQRHKRSARPQVYTYAPQSPFPCCREYHMYSQSNRQPGRTTGLNGTMDQNLNMSALLENSNVHSQCHHCKPPAFSSQGLSTEIPSSSFKRPPVSPLQERRLPEDKENMTLKQQRQESKMVARRKLKKVSQYFEDLIKYFCVKAFKVEEQLNNPGLRTNDTNSQSSDYVLEAKAYFSKRQPDVLNGLKQLLKRKAVFLENASQMQSARFANQDHGKEPPSIVSARRDTQEDDYYEPATGSMRNSHPDFNRLNLHRRTASDERSQANTMTERSTATQTEQIANLQLQNYNLAQQFRQVFQKFVQTGRSLAGICYGGCLFLGKNEEMDTRKNVEFAMSFLAQDTTQLEEICGQNLEQFMPVIENLMASMSQIVQVSCRALVKLGSTGDKNLDSLQAKSLELSMEEGHIFNENLSNFLMPSNNDPSQLNVTGHSASKTGFVNTHVKDKLLEVETKLKHKFSSIQRLEAKLEQLLASCKQQSQKEQKQRSDSDASISSNLNIFMDTSDLFKLLSAIKRVISKLKIDLHQDYLLLGQVNVVLSKESQENLFVQSSKHSTSQMRGRIGTDQSTGQAQAFIKVYQSQNDNSDTSQTMTAGALQNNFSMGSMENKMQIWTPSLNCLESRQQTAEVFSSDSTTHDFINTDSDDKSGVNTSESHFKAKQVQHVLHNMQQMVSTFGNSKTQLYNDFRDKNQSLRSPVCVSSKNSNNNSVTQSKIPQPKMSRNVAKVESSLTQKEKSTNEMHKAVRAFQYSSPGSALDQRTAHVPSMSFSDNVGAKNSANANDSRTFANLRSSNIFPANSKFPSLEQVTASQGQHYSLNSSMGRSLDKESSATLDKASDPQHINKIVQELQRLTFDEDN